MKPRVGVLDYGMGNLHSVAKALEAAGGEVLVSHSRRSLAGCDGLVVPGVGHFGAALENLGRRGLSEFIRRWVLEGKSFLGICLGLQVLFEKSEEKPSGQGLGIFRGRVRAFEGEPFKNGRLKTPHMGWNRVIPKAPGTMFRGIPSGSYFYFVHSYYPEPREQDLVLAETLYGVRFSSAVSRGPLFACQFHPEKSGAVGLRLLKNFLTLVELRTQTSLSHPRCPA